MRFVTILLTPMESAFDPTVQAFADDSAVKRRTLDHIRMLDDGTGVLLVQFDGERERAEALLDAHSDILAYDISEVDNSLYAYVHQKWSEIATTFHSIVQTHGLVVDTPMTYTEDDDLRVTLLGEQQTIQTVLTEIPVAFDLTVEAIGEYNPSTTRLFEQLTERQQEAVTVALKLGYFRDPRTATYKDIGEELGCGPETVGEHLRKAQATIFAELVP
ncbi:helix-turn-helix domain-containing protein [Haladaptatus halobius]|uniref:helix-turn-helix domain-containing protein n=1 Tax=Haladaptatus halobius TaxID=2884875 RepID=UPI001D0B2917|nr:helix-turn-helix domain-containing protein [Haladaptatus halobius]